MSDKKIRKIVVGSMNEITEGLIKAKYVPKNFAEKYKKKEISRFQNKLLFDPISRVAREPLRKLGKENRIVLSLRLAQRNKFPPKNIAIGVKAALYYYDRTDKESIKLQKLRQKYSDSISGPSIIAKPIWLNILSTSSCTCDIG